VAAGELHVRRAEPLLAETPLDLLGRSPVTPNELFFVRNHGPVPDLDAAGHTLTVGGLVDRVLVLSLADLDASFERVSVDAVLACAGNRRAELAAVAPMPGQTPWGAGAIGCARWSGVRLRDVLAAAGVQAGAQHVAFTGLDQAPAASGPEDFAGSIPLSKALAPEVLLADRMNGEPLPAEHGFPLRVVVPGFVGARSVKWLSAVTVLSEQSQSFFQIDDYCVDGEPLLELPLNSAICRAELTGTTLAVQGYAVGGCREVVRVEISLDGGAWLGVELDENGAGPWTWRLWRAELHVDEPPRELAVRAFDSAGATQPEDPAPLWNPRGYMNNAWHRVRLASA
jgi:sulfite oxidase